MAQLIDTRQELANPWRCLELESHPESVADSAAGAPDFAAPDFVPPNGPTLYPLALWLAHRAAILAAGQPLGLLLQPEDKVEDIAPDLPHFQLIAINFPKFVDGRGYSSAALLRQRYAYAGELRAVGDVLHDQLFYLRRVGFDSYALKDGKSSAYAIERGFTPFSASYQASTDQPLPHFRRQP